MRVGRGVNVLCKQIAMHDRELASQVRRAWVRTGMNAGEGQYRRGAKGQNRFDDAMGEAREAYTGLGMARAFDYVDDALCTEVIAEVDRVVGCLYVLAHRPRRTPR